MKFASFDLEIAKMIPNGEDFNNHYPLGISCAAVALEDDVIEFWSGVPQMSPEECHQMLDAFEQMVREGYTLLTWNGTKFDFRVLAEETREFERCAELALNHVDLMLQFTFTKGYYLGLDAALQGAMVAGKLHEVKLNDGSVLHEMSGAIAPVLWSKGEYSAVLEYLKSDVIQPLQLAYVVERDLGVKWTSKSGRPMKASFDRIRTVRECLELPPVDTSWMGDPPSRESFFEWMPDGVKPL